MNNNSESIEDIGGYYRRHKDIDRLVLPIPVLKQRMPLPEVVEVFGRLNREDLRNPYARRSDYVEAVEFCGYYSGLDPALGLHIYLGPPELGQEAMVNPLLLGVASGFSGLEGLTSGGRSFDGASVIWYNIGCRRYWKAS